MTHWRLLYVRGVHQRGHAVVVVVDMAGQTEAVACHRWVRAVGRGAWE